MEHVLQSQKISVSPCRSSRIVKQIHLPISIVNHWMRFVRSDIQASTSDVTSHWPATKQTCSLKTATDWASHILQGISLNTQLLKNDKSFISSSMEEATLPHGLAPQHQIRIHWTMWNRKLATFVESPSMKPKHKVWCYYIRSRSAASNILRTSPLI